MRLIGWGGSFLLLLQPARLAAQSTPTPAHTRIITIADLTYQFISGIMMNVSSKPDTVIVGEMPGVAVSAAPAGSSDPSKTAVFSHTLRNIGNVDDTFALQIRSQSGWPVRIYRDVNGDGLLDAGDVQVTAVPLAAGGSTVLLFAVDVPYAATTRGHSDTLQLVATSHDAPGVLDAVTDQLQIRDAGILVTLSQSVDRTTATPGDVLTYTINYAASGPNAASNFLLVDPVPAGTAYLPGSIRLNGHQQTDAQGDDSGTFDVTNNRVQVTLATITGGDTGTVTFQVRVSP